MNKQDTNLKAAKLCGITARTILNCANLIISQHPVLGIDGSCWDIFADTPQGAWCREQVVISLDLNHNIIIRVARDYRQPKEWLWNNIETQSISDDYNSRTEAIAAAVEHLEATNG